MNQLHAALVDQYVVEMQPLIDQLKRQLAFLRDVFPGATAPETILAPAFIVLNDLFWSVEDWRPLGLDLDVLPDPADVDLATAAYLSVAFPKRWELGQPMLPEHSALFIAAKEYLGLPTLAKHP